MIFGTPISRFLNEIIGSILILICFIHAWKSEKPVQRSLELLCYMLAAGPFENIGVWQGIYDYSLSRTMMFGKVPFSILFIEGAIVYMTMYTKNAELIMLCVNFGVSIFLVLKYAKYDKPVDLKKDGLMFWTPVFFHIYALVTCIVMGISKAVPTVIVVTVIHCAYLAYVYQKLKKNNAIV